MPTHVPVETNPQNIRAIADELTRAADELRASADAITSAGFDCLEVVNFGVLKKAVFGTRSYVKAVKDAVWNAKEGRGDFGAPAKKASNGQAKRGRK
jgi:hypothetical protein